MLIFVERATLKPFFSVLSGLLISIRSQRQKRQLMRVTAIMERRQQPVQRASTAEKHQQRFRVMM